MDSDMRRGYGRERGDLFGHVSRIFFLRAPGWSAKLALHFRGHSHQRKHGPHRTGVCQKLQFTSDCPILHAALPTETRCWPSVWEYTGLRSTMPSLQPFALGTRTWPLREIIATPAEQDRNASFGVSPPISSPCPSQASLLPRVSVSRSTFVQFSFIS
jgi:hypothetical protein